MKTIGIIANLTKKQSLQVARKVIRFFKSYRINVLLDRPLAKALHKPRLGVSINALARESEVVFALGGDGTFLRAARLIHKHLKPILGVHLGGLGFLAEVNVDTLENDLKLLIKGEYNIDFRMSLEGEVLRCKVKKPISIQPVLNDVVISKTDLSRLITLETYIDDEYITTYNADGIIIATPTGSTAYTLSAGGPIVYPGSEVILVAPICPHLLAHRPLVVPATSKVKIRLGADSGCIALTMDGQVVQELLPGDWVIIGKGSQEIPLISFADTSYFDVLKKKLHWGSRS